jgi:hypothetical protein
VDDSLPFWGKQDAEIKVGWKFSGREDGSLRNKNPITETATPKQSLELILYIEYIKPVNLTTRQ